MKIIEHSRLDFFPQSTDKPKGMCTASAKSCCGCGELISVMGGGGLYMCKPCIQTLSIGLLASEFRKEKHSI